MTAVNSKNAPTGDRLSHNDEIVDSVVNVIIVSDDDVLDEEEEDCLVVVLLLVVGMRDTTVSSS
jgi:hypothetical protein